MSNKYLMKFPLHGYLPTDDGEAVVQYDVYDVLIAFGVTCPATQHAIKKLLMAGKRGSKSVTDDLLEAKDAICRAWELACDNEPEGV